MSVRGRTNHETEIKLRVADIPAVLRDLRRLGAKDHGRVFEANALYDTPNSDFWRRHRLLRLRTETPAPSEALPGGRSCAVVTSKAPVPGARHTRYKQNFEREVAIRFPGRWPRILRALGLRPGFRYEKYRTAFSLPGLHLDLDETPVGVFLELEGSPHVIDRIARALGFSPRDYIRGTYWDLYQAECRRTGRIPRNLLFRR
ncbi:MAG: class IV adenylate cyclase [Candidatus Acidiferrales bacterium]|jgi:adenylate cyclase, class 2